MKILVNFLGMQLLDKSRDNCMLFLQLYQQLLPMPESHDKAS